MRIHHASAINTRTAWAACRSSATPITSPRTRDLSEAGLTGIGVSFVNYADELPYFCDEVLPRLQRMGLREKVKTAAGVISTRPAERSAAGGTMPTPPKWPADDLHIVGRGPHGNEACVEADAPFRGG